MRISDWSSDVCSSDLHGQDASMAPRRRRDTRKGLAAGPACRGHRPGLLLAATVLACLSAPLHAQSWPFSGEVALSSQLVDRGLAISPATPILQGSASWMSPGGWSMGLAGGVELRSPGQPVVVLGRVSRLDRTSTRLNSSH